MDFALYMQFLTEGMEWSKLGNALMKAFMYREASVQYKKLLEIKAGASSSDAQTTAPAPRSATTGRVSHDPAGWRKARLSSRRRFRI